MKIIRATVLATILGSTAVIAQQALPQVQATVTKVDKAADRITLDHGPIPNLDMEGMTMMFRPADKAMLDQVKAGDHIMFSADRVNGQLTIVKIELAPAGAGGVPAN